MELVVGTLYQSCAAGDQLGSNSTRNADFMVGRDWIFFYTCVCIGFKYLQYSSTRTLVLDQNLIVSSKITEAYILIKLNVSI